MLTQDQIEKLQPLTKHEKYGKLLEEAIKAWEYINPVSNDFGINPFSSEKIITCSGGYACLIGASIIGKEFKNQLYKETMEYYFDISENEMWSLIEGFDFCEKGEHAAITIDQAYKFGKVIREIVNPKTIEYIPFFDIE